MIRAAYIVPLALTALGACRQDPEANSSIDIENAARQAQGTVNAYGERVAADRAHRAAPTPASSPVATRSPTPAPLQPPAPGTPGGLPDDRRPVSEASFTPDSAQGAANVVQTYFALLGERRYAQARALWTPGAAGAGPSPAAFAADFARYGEYRGLVGAPGKIEAGAGQRYVTVPVQVAARLKSGAEIDQRGEVVLHRTGDIDGATPDQRRWRLQTITLRTTEAPSAIETVTRYRCIDGSRLTVSFDDARARATIRSGGRVEAVLQGQRTGGRMSYRGRGYALSGTAKQATFMRPERPPLACAAR